MGAFRTPRQAFLFECVFACQDLCRRCRNRAVRSARQPPGSTDSSVHGKGSCEPERHANADEEVEARAYENEGSVNTKGLQSQKIKRMSYRVVVQNRSSQKSPSMRPPYARDNLKASRQGARSARRRSLGTYKCSCQNMANKQLRKQITTTRRRCWMTKCLQQDQRTSSFRNTPINTSHNTTIRCPP